MPDRKNQGAEESVQPVTLLPSDSGEARDTPHASLSAPPHAATAILSPKTKVPHNRRGRSSDAASISVTPISVLPHTTNGAERAVSPRRRRGRKGADTPDQGAPPAQHNGEGLPALIARLTELQRLRCFTLKSQQRCDRSIESLIVSVVLGGLHSVETEAQRKALFKQAAKIRKFVERDQLALDVHTGAVRFNGARDHTRHDTQVTDVPDTEDDTEDEGHPLADIHAGTLASILPAIQNSATARVPYDNYRKEIEAEMERASTLLPVYEWAKTVPGLLPLGLAILIAEIGQGRHGNGLRDFKTVSAVWKRLGLAVIDGRRQQRIKNDKELAIRHGYSAARRAQVHVVGSTSVFLAAKPGSKYREAYLKRRRVTEPRIAMTADLRSDSRDKWSKSRCDDDARRYMTKVLIIDLWNAWREATS